MRNVPIVENVRKFAQEVLSNKICKRKNKELYEIFIQFFVREKNIILLTIRGRKSC